jgi:hypothetical protein
MRTIDIPLTRAEIDAISRAIARSLNDPAFTRDHKALLGALQKLDHAG